MIDAATVDVRGAYILKDMLTVVGDDPTLKPYTDLLYLVDGFGCSSGRPGSAPATTPTRPRSRLMDTWYPLVAKEVLRPRLGSLVDSIPTTLDDRPTDHNGSAFDNVGSYEWVTKDLESVLGRIGRRARCRSGYCGKGDLATCRNEIRQTLSIAVATLDKTAADHRPDEVDLRQGQRRHPVHVRRRHGRAHRLAEPADVPAGDRLTADARLTGADSADRLTENGARDDSVSCHGVVMGYAVEAAGLVKRLRVDRGAGRHRSRCRARAAFLACSAPTVPARPRP